MIQHHINYKELDGYDEIKLISLKEHGDHQKERGYTIPRKVVIAAHRRSPKGKETSAKYTQKYRAGNLELLYFSESLGANVNLDERWVLNIHTGLFTVETSFQGNHGKIPYRIEEGE